MSILVTGGTGTTGRAVAEFLRRDGHQVRTASRSGADVRFDWSDPGTHATAVQGATAMYLVPPTGAAEPLPLVASLLEHAQRAGLRRVVLLSASAVEPGSPGLGELTTAVSGAVPEWSVLRPTWFASNFTGDHFHARRIRRHDEVVSATSTGRVPFIDPADIAESAARALVDPVPLQGDVVLTGPEALDFAAVAELVAGFTGRPIRHRAVSVSELAALHHEDGLPTAFAHVLAGMDLPIAAGAEDRTTSGVEKLTGRPPRSFEAHLAVQPVDALTPSSAQRSPREQ